MSLAGIMPLCGMEEPILPKWNGNDKKELESAGWVAGGLLLTDDPVPDDQNPEITAELKVEQPTAEEIAQDAEHSPEIPEKFLPAYFAERPKTFLVDPQGLLSPANFRDRLSFLNYHASDSSIDLFVYVIGGDQEIPSEVREEEMIERFFSQGRPAVIAYYYLGSPQRSVVYLSPSLTDVVSAAEQRRALASSVVQAFEKLNPPEQLDAFLVQMSIRVYWMERMIGRAATPVEVAPVPRAVAIAAEKTLANNQKIEWARAIAMKYAMPAGATLAFLLAALSMNFWLKRGARYVFPDFDVEPRLGGAHAAGVGAVISFASAALPPASQRDQVPDYLRRA
ncbi:MAG: hypothetical protein ABI600_01165 [Luteolibacter sp.]